MASSRKSTVSRKLTDCTAKSAVGLFLGMNGPLENFCPSMIEASLPYHGWPPVLTVTCCLSELRDCRRRSAQKSLQQRNTSGRVEYPPRIGTFQCRYMMWVFP